MSIRSIEVDLGPMHLQVGMFQDQRQMQDADATCCDQDADRFRTLLSNRRSNSNDMREEMEADQTEAEVSFRPVWNDNQISEEIEYLFGSLGDGPTVDSKRQVFVGVRRDILPETDIRILEEEGRLHVNIISANPDVQRWVAFSLKKLARAIGQKLARPMRLTLSSQPSDAGIISSTTWPGGFLWEETT
jgi:hypothetical protein